MSRKKIFHSFALILILTLTGLVAGDTGDGGQTTGGDKGNNSSDKDSSRTNGTNTGVAVGMGLFGGLAGISALGAGVLSFLKRRKK